MSLCVMTPIVGSANETYIRRHANELAPGNTAVIALHQHDPAHKVWDVEGPLLLLPHTCHEDDTSSSAVTAQIVEFWKRHNVSVVLAEYLQFAVQYVLLARTAGVRLYAHGHGFDCSALLRQDAWRTKYQQLRECAGVIVVSTAMRRTLTEFGVPDGIVHRIPCGVDVEDIPLRSKGPKVRLLAVGRLTGKKGPIYLLEAFRRALATNPAIELHLVGEGEFFEAVVQFVDAFSLGSAVALYGVQPPDVVRELMRKSDIFVQHSIVNPLTGDEEGLPVAILEAMAASLPVVSTIHAGIPEAVIDGVTGFVVPERDVAAMADRILLLAGDHCARLEMGGKGQHHIRAQFTWEQERRSLVETMGLREHVQGA